MRVERKQHLALGRCAQVAQYLSHREPSTSLGVRVTSYPRATSAVCSAFIDVSASRGSRGGAMRCRLARYVCCQCRIDLALMGDVEGQSLLHLSHR